MRVRPPNAIAAGLGSDDTLAGQIRMIVTYGVYLTSFLLSILTLFLSAMTLNSEIFFPADCTTIWNEIHRKFIFMNPQNIGNLSPVLLNPLPLRINQKAPALIWIGLGISQTRLHF